MSRAQKGSQFEREICKILSLWWTKGLGMDPTDDVFWRSSQSGGRATQRAKQGKDTFGSHGDIAAVNPIGAPLMKACTIELKRGSSIGTPWDLFDRTTTDAVRPFEAAIAQAIDAHKRAKSRSWILIGRQDHRMAVVYFDLSAVSALCIMPPECRIDMRLDINQPEGSRLMRILGIHLDIFLQIVDPKEIIKAVR